MEKLTLTIELEYDAKTLHGNDIESKDWFYNDCLLGEDGDLILWSNVIGDSVGSVRVLKIEGA